MVCSVGSGRMAVMARLLAAGSFSRNVAEEVGHQKLAAQHIYRELREADEANLLDEEDMHVFGLKPVTDPLHLVCCNACKKPVKASHYAAHAELCRSLSTIEETILEPNGGTGHRKPPRKERKKLLTAYANQATPTGEQERSESIDADHTAVSESQSDGKIGMTSSFFMDAKRNSACIDTTSMMGGSGASPENTHQSARVMAPPTKRSKKKAGECLPLSDDPETASGVTKSTANAHTCRNFPKQTISGSERPNDSIDNKGPGQAHDCCLLAKDVPIPLATKIYYSQRNNRLRSVLSHLYCEASTKEISSDMLCSQVSQQNIMPSRASSRRNSSLEQVDDLLNRKLEPSVQKPDQILAQSSEICLPKSGGYLPTPTSNFSNQLPVDNTLMPQTAPVGLTRTKYLSKPYSFAGNSGKLLGPMQQPNGSVPVV